MSPAFLGNAYIRRHELPHLLGALDDLPQSRKRVAPILLQPLNLRARLDFGGLDERQIFSLDKKSFAECGGPNRTKFANAVFDAIDRMLERLPPPAPPPPPPTLDDALREQAHHQLKGLHLARAFGRASSMDRFDPAETRPGERHDALGSGLITSR